MYDITDKMIEEYRDGAFEKATPADIVLMYPFMREFFKQINWWGNKTVCLKLKGEDYSDYGRYRIYLYTEKREYAIDVGMRNGSDKTYVGGVYSLRSPLPMETWTRGRDLTDGYNGMETLTTILMEIVALELNELDVEGYDKINTFVYKG
jgi:hypothetical protein